MWLTLLSGVLKRPWIIALVIMGVLMGGMWIKINLLKGDVVDLRDEIVRIEGNFNTCKSNEHTLNGALDSLNTQISEFESNIALMEEQVDIEKGRVVYWRDKYNNKICYKPSDEVVVIKKDETRVLNDEKNTDAVNRINTIFGD